MEVIFLMSVLEFALSGCVNVFHSIFGLLLMTTFNDGQTGLFSP